jgi:hypothetical protein
VIAMLEAARLYALEGLIVTPLNGKIPMITAWQLQPKPTDSDLISWFATGNHNIGIRTGLISRLAAIDIDAAGKEVFNQTGFSAGLKDKIANTRMTKTGGGGYHILFRFSLTEFPDGIETVKLWHKAGVKGEILLQGNNRQVVSPPSIHPETKKPYESNCKDLLEITKAEYLEILAAFGKAPKGEVYYFQGPNDEPEYTNKLAPKKMQQALKLLLPHYTKGSRHDIVFSLAGTYRKAGVPQSNTEMFVTMLGNAAGDDRAKIADNLRMVREQYRRDINLPIAGRKMLRGLLSE